MPLIKPEPPTPATLAFRNGLQAFLAGPAGGVANVVGDANLSTDTMPSEADFSPPGGPWEHDPQKVFTLGLSDVKTGGIAAAKLVSWRYFAGNAPGKIVLGNVSQRHINEPWKLRSVFYGYRVTAALLHSHEVDSLPHVQVENYELRFLRIPGLNLEAFWLMHLTAPGSSVPAQPLPDLVAVFPPPPNQLYPQLNVSKVITMAAFLDIIVPLAVEGLTMPNDEGA
jgi:hypothetical protein